MSTNSANTARQKPKTKRALNGVLLLDKPLGVSSNHALQQVKKLFQAQKAGHTGSLDPLASGMLPICFGEATKFAQYGLDADKTYQVRAQLGQISSTGDAEGELTTCMSVNQLRTLDYQQLIHTALEKLTGSITQVPPMYSALKHQGKPLYEYARQGQQIERAARAVKIYQFQLLSDLEQLAKLAWQLEFQVRCSKGTYIRTLIEDFGQLLGCGAYVTELRRISVTPFEQASMVSLDQLTSLSGQLAELDHYLLPTDSVMQHWPIYCLTDDLVNQLTHGQALTIKPQLIQNKQNKTKINPLTNPNPIRFYDLHNNFLGIAYIDYASGEIIKRRLLSNN